MTPDEGETSHAITAPSLAADCNTRTTDVPNQHARDIEGAQRTARGSKRGGKLERQDRYVT
jgi:hypothetical protein